MVSKIFITFISLLILSGCGLGDYTQSLANGYYYNDWGRKFITYKNAENDESVVIDSEVINYQLENNILLVSQVPKMLESGNSQLVFWLINTNSGEALQFGKKEDFIIAAKSKGLSIEVFDKIVH